jgi:1-aminocyclopropane-1-carboxylate deaminase/D-cysteine desulfhydrase-like pyridoxal-dependent ACC family enzyme
MQHACGLQLDHVTPACGRGGRGFTVVRDDLLHPVAGGNKMRKLDALLPALLSAGATDIVRRSAHRLSSRRVLRAACQAG